jgi:hypothetical protein
VARVVLGVVEAGLELFLLVQQDDVVLDHGSPLDDAVNHRLGDCNQLLDLLQLLARVVNVLRELVLLAAIKLQVLDGAAGCIEDLLLARVGSGVELLVDEVLYLIHDVSSPLLALHLIMEAGVVGLLGLLCFRVENEVLLEDLLNGVEVSEHRFLLEDLWLGDALELLLDSVEGLLDGFGHTLFLDLLNGAFGG